MKTNLTPEQSQRLIELGVNPSLASENTEYGAWADSEHGKPIFTLTDVISLLPKKIEAEIQNVRRVVQLEVRWHGDCWLARYSDLHGDIVDDKTSPKLDYELIDALYELTIWCIENNHLKV